MKTRLINSSVQNSNHGELTGLFLSQRNNGTERSLLHKILLKTSFET